MESLLELLRSLGCGVVLAGLSLLVAAHRVRKAQRLQMAGFVDGEQDRIGRYRSMGGRISETRTLTDRERRMLSYLLCEATIVPGPFCSQLATATVVARCGCGCPSIDLAVAERPANGGLLFPICEYLWRDDDGKRFGIMPLAKGGVLFGLQVYPLDGAAKPKELPAIEELQPFRWIR